jgi:hypothetical protein
LWKKINIVYEIQVKFDDSLFLDTTINKKIHYNLLKKNLGWLNNLELKWKISPKDEFNLIENIKILPSNVKRIIWIIWLGFLLFIGFIIYSWRDYKGDFEIIWIVISDIIFFLLLFYIIVVSKLGEYMKISMKNKNIIFSKDWVYRLKDIIEWKSNVDLENLEVKIVAHNYEIWQYDGWKNNHVATFIEPINHIELFSKTFSFIPKNTDISNYLDWEVSFKDIYEKIFPQFMVSPTHWLNFHCEIQLISEKYADKRLIIPYTCFDEKEFSKENFIDNKSDLEFSDLELENLKSKVKFNSYTLNWENKLSSSNGMKLSRILIILILCVLLFVFYLQIL